MSNNETIINKLEGGRAEYAYKCVENAKKGGCDLEEYSSHIKKIPMLIKTNGLGATLAFMFSKKEKDNSYKLIYSHIFDWFKDHEPNGILKNEIANHKNIAFVMTTIASDKYKAASCEVLSLFSWLKRFADGTAKEAKNANKKQESKHE